MSEQPASMPEPRPPQYDEDVAMGRAINAANDLFDRLQGAEARADTLQHGIDHDKKTGLYSEGKWHEELDRAIENHAPGDKITVFVIDLNGFKGANDALGHTAGDELLRIAGSAISQAFQRQGEVIAHGQQDHDANQGIARLGGDEYAIFSVEKPSDDPENHRRNLSPDEVARIQTERANMFIAEAVAGTKFENHPITVSTGAAQVDLDAGATEQPGVDAFVRADAAMYTMKYRGKIDQITPEDRQYLHEIIPYLESKGARVESWLKDAAYGSN